MELGFDLGILSLYSSLCLPYLHGEILMYEKKGYTKVCNNILDIHYQLAVAWHGLIKYVGTAVGG